MTPGKRVKGFIERIGPLKLLPIRCNYCDGLPTEHTETCPETAIRRLTAENRVLLDYVKVLGLDHQRLEWLTHSDALLAYSQDGDDCWLHWPYEEGGVNQVGTFDSPREAIDAALAARTPGDRGVDAPGIEITTEIANGKKATT